MGYVTDVLLVAGTQRDAWRAAAECRIFYDSVFHGPIGVDHPAHLDHHLPCAAAGLHETVYTRCCGTPVPLGRPMWPCEIPHDAGLIFGCCDRPWAVFGDPR